MTDQYSQLMQCRVQHSVLCCFAKSNTNPNRDPENCFVKAHWHLQVTQSFSGGCCKDIVHNLTLEMDLEMVLGILNDVAVAMAYIYHLAEPIPHQQLSSGRVGDKTMTVPDLASFLAWLCMHMCFMSSRTCPCVFAAKKGCL